ncbi:MAG: alkaline phosphatase D family protein [Gemmatimonadetes bacterium]|nr:alkaline phosphatase D family protein [Gemmatimonadota bacterium]
MDRRLFLSDLTRYAVLCAGAPNLWRLTTRPVLSGNPFALGVASGDPTPNACVIWTRLAPDPFAPHGGMDGQKVVLDWEVADDEGFSKVVKRGRYTCAPELGYSVHVDVQGLAPDRWYFYRFTLPAGSSTVGRLRTTPLDGAQQPLDFAFVSCQHYEQGLFTAFDHLAAERLDLVTHLGDYIYETATREDVVRPHHGFEIITVEDYRNRYAQYKLDPALQKAHAMCPWIVTWDDHEVDNNYAGSVGENVFESDEQMRQRRAAGYQAWWEHQPVRVPRARSWADLNITRTANWGRWRALGDGHAAVSQRPGVRRWPACDPLRRLERSVEDDDGRRAGAVAAQRPQRVARDLAGAGAAGDDGAARQSPRRRHPGVDGPVGGLSRRA